MGRNYDHLTIGFADTNAAMNSGPTYVHVVTKACDADCFEIRRMLVGSKLTGEMV